MLIIDTQRLDKLKEEKKRINTEIALLLEQNKHVVIVEILKTMDDYSITIEDIQKASKKRSRSAAKPKYRDPVTLATWSGRGKRPAWIKGDLSQYAIEN